MHHRLPRELKADVDRADIIVVRGHVLEMVPSLQCPTSTKIVVCDLYDPMHLEPLEQARTTMTTDGRRISTV